MWAGEDEDEDDTGDENIGDVDTGEYDDGYADAEKPNQWKFHQRLCILILRFMLIIF